MSTGRRTVTSAPSLTRASETWPVYNVRAQCLATLATIALIVIALVLVVIL